MPGAVPHTSTYALTNATLPYIHDVAVHGAAGGGAARPGDRARRQHRRRAGDERAGRRVPRRRATSTRCVAFADGRRRRRSGRRMGATTLGVRPRHPGARHLAETPTARSGAAQLRAAAGQSWIARNPFGYTILHYDDVVADAARQALAQRDVDGSWRCRASPTRQYLDRRRTSILSAEGDEHTRLRRLVGKAFSPRAADRLRPFMREVDQRARRRGRADAVGPTSPSTSASRTRSRSSASCSARRRRTGSSSAAGPTDVLRIFNGNLARGPADDRRRPGRARRVHPRADRRPPRQAGRRPAHRPHRRRGGRATSCRPRSW